MEQKAIQITLGDENRIFIEKNVLHSQLFSDQYGKIIKKISDYISNVNPEDSRINSNSNSNINNIFLINGERGAGKTSMLVSLHECMKVRDKKENIFKKRFLQIPIIDPSSFTDNANILQIIIAELFKEFKKDNADRKINYEAKNEIINIFVRIKHALCILDAPSKASSNLDDSDIESLTDMSNAMDLEDLIQKLVELILKERGEDMLLVCIDDIDLNTSYAYEMLEQIRKYLIFPKVVVIIAAKYHQLHEVVQQHFFREYKELISNDVMNARDVQEMSNKYLLKLLPLEQRVNLNTAIEKLHQPIEVYSGENKVVAASNGDELIYKLIYQKTGLQYMSVQDSANYIVPNNLRAFRFLIKILCDMEEDKKGKNIDEYQHYFLSEWVPEHLQSDEQQDIQGMLTDSDSSKINKQIIQCITQRLQLNDNYPPLISILVDPSNIYTNVSLGDVMSVITWSKSVNSSEQFARYIYAIKHAYTILLEKAYQEMLKDDAIQKKVDMYKADDAPEYLNSYQRLVGGALLNGLTWDYLLPSSTITENRLHRSIAINSSSQPKLSGEILKYLIVTPSRVKAVNEGEAYRKQMQIYYQQSLYKYSQVIIDCFNPLYAVPFSIEHLPRFNEDENKLDILNSLKNEIEDDKLFCKSMFVQCIHSIDILEKIYWHLRANRNYLRQGPNKADIYSKLYKKISEIAFAEYISQEDGTQYKQLMSNIASKIEKEKEIIVQLLEEIPQKPIHSLGFPELITIRDKCNTVADIKARMRAINEWKGYKPEWLDSEVDKLGFTDEEIQNEDPRVIRNRLKRMGKNN